MNGVYFYEIGYHSFEDSYYETLMHHKVFSKEEIDDLCVQSCLHILREWTASKSETLSPVDSNSIFNPGDFLFTFACLFRLVPSVLVDKYQFTRVVYTHRSSVFGWASLDHPEDWGESQSDLNLKILSAIEKEGLVAEIIRKNNEIEGLLDDGLKKDANE